MHYCVCLKKKEKKRNSIPTSSNKTILMINYKESLIFYRLY